MNDQQQPSPEDPADRQKLWEHQQRTYDLNQRHAERAHDANTEFFNRTNESAIKNAESAVKAVMVINGGATVSILAFIGGLAAQGKVPFGQLAVFANCLTWFASGVALAAAMAAFAYFTNYCIAGSASRKLRNWEHPYLHDTPQSKRWQRAGIIFHVAATATGLGSLIVFICGMISVRNAILHLG
jgi:hypothetical protein